MKISPISVRLTKTEKLLLQDIACSKGLSLSDTIRDLIRENSSRQDALTILKRIENKLACMDTNDSSLDCLIGELNLVRSDLVNTHKMYLNSVFNRLCLTELMLSMGQLDGINSRFVEFKQTRGLTE